MYWPGIVAAWRPREGDGGDQDAKDSEQALQHGLPLPEQNLVSADCSRMGSSSPGLPVAICVWALAAFQCPYRH